jgi:SAM-dependent methyltransferase
MQWEQVERCDFCGGSATNRFMDSSVPHWYERRPLILDECTGCGLVRANPRPLAAELYSRYLNAHPIAHSMLENKLARPNISKHHRAAVELAISGLGHPAASLLDMGCGAGTVMMQARELGLEAEGNDVNKASIDHLKSLGFRAHLGFTHQISYHRRYDIVMNMDYIEHSYYPFHDIKTCHDVIFPNVILYLKTLYLGSPDHVAQGEKWKLFGPGGIMYLTAHRSDSILGFKELDRCATFQTRSSITRQKPAVSWKPNAGPMACSAPIADSSIRFAS